MTPSGGVSPISFRFAVTATATDTGPLRSAASRLATPRTSTPSTSVSAQLESLVFTSAVAWSPFFPSAAGSTLAVCG